MDYVQFDACNLQVMLKGLSIDLFSKNPLNEKKEKPPPKQKQKPSTSSEGTTQSSQQGDEATTPKPKNFRGKPDSSTNPKTLASLCDYFDFKTLEKSEKCAFSSLKTDGKGVALLTTEQTSVKVIITRLSFT